ncbi:MAG: arginine decarboxylase [Salinirussus sp.]|jgi:arginine decarboxylase
MSLIRVVWGSGTGPTETAAYDAALTEAGVHDYNLVTVSSVVPADPAVEAVGTAPTLGPVGEGLTVVQARAGVAPAGGAESGDPGERAPVVAAVGWARSADGPGIFYEADGRDPEHVRETVADGLQRGCALREWEPADTELVVRTATPAPDRHTCVVVCAVYGESQPLL